MIHNIQCKLNKNINNTGILEIVLESGRNSAKYVLDVPLKPASPSLISKPPDFSQMPFFFSSHEPHEKRTSPTDCLYKYNSMSCKSVHFMRPPASPKELAGLVSKLNVDCTAGAEVLPHDGDFGASGLWTSAGGQTRDGGSLSSKAGREEKERLRDKLSSESEDAGGTASFIASIHVFPPTHGQNYSYSYCRARGGRSASLVAEKQMRRGALPSPRETPPLRVSHITGLVSERSVLRTVWK